MKIQITVAKQIEIEVDDKFATLGINHPDFVGSSEDEELIEEFDKVVEEATNYRCGWTFDTLEEANREYDSKGVVILIESEEYGTIAEW